VTGQETGQETGPGQVTRARARVRARAGNRTRARDSLSLRPSSENLRPQQHREGTTATNTTTSQQHGHQHQQGQQQHGHQHHQQQQQHSSRGAREGTSRAGAWGWRAPGWLPRGCFPFPVRCQPGAQLRLSLRTLTCAYGPSYRFRPPPEPWRQVRG